MDFIVFKSLMCHTPTTKADVGHEEKMTPSDLVELLGKEMTERVKQAALALFEGGIGDYACSWTHSDRHEAVRLGQTACVMSSTK